MFLVSHRTPAGWLSWKRRILRSVCGSVSRTRVPGERGTAGPLSPTPWLDCLDPRVYVCDHFWIFYLVVTVLIFCENLFRISKLRVCRTSWIHYAAAQWLTCTFFKINILWIGFCTFPIIITTLLGQRWWIPFWWKCGFEQEWENIMHHITTIVGSLYPIYVR